MSQFRRRRDDTLVGTIERQYGVELHARADMKLGSLLRERGFESLTQLLTAYKRQLPYHAAPRSIFLSFHAEDMPQVSGFRLMVSNPRVALTIADEPARYPVNSEHSGYIRARLRERIARVEVLICLVGNGTAWRDWVDWEIETAASFHRGICVVRLKGSRGRVPHALRRLGSPIASWSVPEIIAAIESAAARRS